MLLCLGYVSSALRHGNTSLAFANHRGWEPKELTDSGRPKIDEKILMEIDTDESKVRRILELQNTWACCLRAECLAQTCN